MYWIRLFHKLLGKVHTGKTPYQESKQLHVCHLPWQVVMYHSLLIEQLAVLVLNVSGASILLRNLGPDITYRKKFTP